MTTATVWVRWVDLDAPGDHDALVSAAERARAERLRRVADRRRFVVGRAALRRALAERLGEAPAALRLVEGPFGKPCLANQAVAFNLSNSGGRAVIAIGGRRALGVDTEAVVVDAAAMRDALAPFLSPAERLAAATASTAELHRWWCRKEAIGKADGQGMGFPFAAASVIGGGDRLVKVAGRGAFRVCDLAAPPGYAAALAVAGAEPVEVVPLTPASPATRG